jgi:small subunit ribosomal protein S4
MARYTGPKAKLCRREGENLFGSAKYTKILTKKNYAPGAHGKTRVGKSSEFASQLREKQKLARMFGLSLRQMTKYFDKASRAGGSSSVNLLSLIERRLDNAIYRAGLAMTRMQARQFASHGLLSVNGVRVTIPSIQLSPGDQIEVRQRSKQSKVFEDIRKENAKYNAPSWMNADRQKLTIEIKDIPAKEHFEQSVDAQKIVEFFSK